MEPFTRDLHLNAYITHVDCTAILMNYVKSTILVKKWIEAIVFGLQQQKLLSILVSSTLVTIGGDRGVSGLIKT